MNALIILDELIVFSRNYRLFIIILFGVNINNVVNISNFIRSNVAINSLIIKVSLYMCLNLSHTSAQEWP